LAGNAMKIKSPITLFAVAFALHAQTDRPVYGHDPGGNRYSPLKQITPKNVAKLQLAWSYDTQAPINCRLQVRPPRQEPTGGRWTGWPWT
jgi:glucose dehydrogenase